MFALLSNPLFWGLAGAVYILFVQKPKDEETNQAATPAESKGLLWTVIGITERKVLQRAQHAAAEAKLPLIANLLSAISLGDGVGLTNVAEQMADNLQSVEGRRFMLGKLVRTLIADFAKNDASEFAAIASQRVETLK